MTKYKTTGTCSSAIEYEVADGIVTKCRFIGGCPGNTTGVAKLVIGRKIEDVIALLKGIQ
ncbi:MAG: TSCPD domain-containing protein, partial [Kiritimatiellae bacterium]|nr:TSCPD domain-containing protein [Kiritimatiellia bacterium]